MKKFFVSMNGVLRGLKGRPIEVQRPLLSVWDMVKAGHRVVFDEDDETHEDTSYALHKKTGQKIDFRAEARTWRVDGLIVPYAESEVALTEAELASFQRQAHRP